MSAPHSIHRARLESVIAAYTQHLSPTSSKHVGINIGMPRAKTLPTLGERILQSPLGRPVDPDVIQAYERRGDDVPQYRPSTLAEDGTALPKVTWKPPPKAIPVTEPIHVSFKDDVDMNKSMDESMNGSVDGGLNGGEDDEDGVDVEALLAVDVQLKRIAEQLFDAPSSTHIQTHTQAQTLESTNIDNDCGNVDGNANIKIETTHVHVSNNMSNIMSFAEKLEAMKTRVQLELS